MPSWENKLAGFALAATAVTAANADTGTVVPSFSYDSLGQNRTLIVTPRGNIVELGKNNSLQSLSTCRDFIKSAQGVTGMVDDLIGSYEKDTELNRAAKSMPALMKNLIDGINGTFGAYAQVSGQCDGKPGVEEGSAPKLADTLTSNAARINKFMTPFTGR